MIVDTYYSILSGLFVYNSNHLDDISKYYEPWKARVFNGDYEGTFEFIKNSYYSGFINNIFPEINDNYSFYNKTLVKHLTSKKCTNTQSNFKKCKLVINHKEIIDFKIDFIDVYLFPHDIGVFSFKVKLIEENFNEETVSDFSNKIRLLYSEIKMLNGELLNLKSFVEKYIFKGIDYNRNWVSYNPQLKSYHQINIHEDLSFSKRKYLIFDIGNASPIGTSIGDSDYAPSDNYFNNQIENNMINIFNNWSALALFDTFTRISVNYKDEFRVWEYNYFNLYVHSLYVKFFLFATSNKLSDVTIVNNETKKIRDEFIEFINDEFHSSVSHKFLPNQIINKLHYSLGIVEEVNNMEIKVKRINDYLHEKRAKKLNIVISLLAFLSIFSSIFDFSEWLISLGYPKEYMFPYTSLGVLSLIIIIMLIVFLRKDE